MESSLHRQLKERYGPEAGGRSEVAFGRFRVDAIAPDGRLIEVQSAPLGRLRPKLERLLPGGPVVVVKPVVVARRLVRRDPKTGLDSAPRRSPKRGKLLDVFDELAALARLFPHENLTIDLLAVEVDEVRVDRRRRPGFAVVDRVLREVIGTTRLRVAADLWSLLPDDLPDRFTTFDLADRLGRPADFGRKVAYCLLHSGAAEVVAKLGGRRVYARKLSGSAGPRGRGRPDPTPKGRGR